MLQTIINEFRLTWRLLLDQRVPLWAKGIPVLAVVYLLSPIDLIPDVILGLGQLDDLGVLLGALRVFRSVVPEHIVDEHLEIIEGNVVDVTDYQVIDKD